MKKKINPKLHCKLCKILLRRENKSGVCSSCGSKTYYELKREGIIK